MRGLILGAALAAACATAPQPVQPAQPDSDRHPNPSCIDFRPVTGRLDPNDSSTERTAGLSCIVDTVEELREECIRMKLELVIHDPDDPHWCCQGKASFEE